MARRAAVEPGGAPFAGGPRAWLQRAAVRRALEALVVSALVIVFFQAAESHADLHNRRSSSSDQSAYLIFAERSSKSLVHLDGSRGPAYPLALLLVHERGLDREVFFARAKTFTVCLTALLWVGMWLVIRRLLPLGQGLVVWTVTGMTCLVHYAPYVKAEAPYFVVNWLAFVLLAGVLVKPSPRTALVAGAVTALGYLLKNSGRILLLAYVAGVLIDVGLGYLQARGAPLVRARQLKPRAIAGFLVLAGFFAVSSPFLIASQLKYGKAFYNVNDFYAWYDSWGQAKEGTRAHGDRDGWPQMREEDIPTARKYFETHSGAEIRKRLERGWKRSLRGLERREMLGYAQLYLAALVILVVARYRSALALAGRYGPLLAFAASYLLGHALLSAWFEVIASGPRVLSAGFPILIFCCAFALFHLAKHQPGASKLWQRTATATALIAALLLPLDISRAVSTNLRASKGGR